MVAACRHGPTSARVVNIVEAAAGSEALGMRHAGDRFSVLPTI
jgi:acylphosphatase